MSTFFGVFRALVYFYQRNHVVQHACDEVYLLQKDHNREKKHDKKKTLCCCERSDSDEKPGGDEKPEEVLKALKIKADKKKKEHKAKFEELKQNLN